MSANRTSLSIFSFVFTIPLRLSSRIIEDTAKPLPPHPVLGEYYRDPSGRSHFVRKLFDSSAPFYDGMTALVSLGSGQWYRSFALGRHGLRPGMRLLDVATGTGVVVQAALKHTKDLTKILGVDASIGMLLEARRKLPLRAVQGSGDALPIRSGMFDMITIGFALRHFADLRRAFEEYHRVLAPGGKLLILEITAPESKIGRAFMGAFMGRLVPAVVRLTTRNQDAALCMKYYWETTRQCVPPASILEALHAAGFQNVQRKVWFGSSSEYSGVK